MRGQHLPHGIVSFTCFMVFVCLPRRIVSSLRLRIVSILPISDSLCSTGIQQILINWMDTAWWSWPSLPVVRPGQQVVRTPWLSRPPLFWPRMPWTVVSISFIHLASFLVKHYPERWTENVEQHRQTWEGKARTRSKGRLDPESKRSRRARAAVPGLGAQGPCR